MAVGGSERTTSGDLCSSECVCVAISAVVLSQVAMFSIGDIVRITQDLERLQVLQHEHGGYISAMQGVSPSFFFFFYCFLGGFLLFFFLQASDSILFIVLVYEMGCKKYHFVQTG